MTGSKHKLYNINPVLNKWEEDNYARLMEGKVRGAKSAGYAARSTSPCRTRSSTVRISTCQRTTYVPATAAASTQHPQQAGTLPSPDTIQAGADAGVIMQQLQQLTHLPQALQQLQQQQSQHQLQHLKQQQHSQKVQPYVHQQKQDQQQQQQQQQHVHIQAEPQDADTVLSGDNDTNAASSTAAAAALAPADLLQCITAAAGPLVNLLQQLTAAASTTSTANNSSSSSRHKTLHVAAATAAAAAGRGSIASQPLTPTRPSRGPVINPGRRTVSPERQTGSHSRRDRSPRKVLPHSPVRQIPSSNPTKCTQLPGSQKPPGAAKQAAGKPSSSSNSSSSKTKPAWDDNYRPPPPVGFAGFKPLPLTKKSSDAASTSKPPQRDVHPAMPAAAMGSRCISPRKQQQHAPAATVAGAAGAAAGARMACAAASKAKTQQQIQQTAAAAAAACLAAQRCRSMVPTSKLQPAAARGPAAAAAAAAAVGGSFLCRVPSAAAVATAAALRYINCRDTDDLPSYRETTASAADPVTTPPAAAAVAAGDASEGQVSDVLCIDNGLYLPLVQRINSSKNRALSAGSSTSSTEHTTWGSSHASSRTHSGRRQQQQQGVEGEDGEEGCGKYTHAVLLPPVATASSRVEVPVTDYQHHHHQQQQQQGYRITLTPSLDLLGGSMQLRASDLLTHGSSNGNGNQCWASRWLCDNTAADGACSLTAAAAAVGTQLPSLPTQQGGSTAAAAAAAAAWEPSASVLQCCSEEEEGEEAYADNVWERED